MARPLAHLLTLALVGCSAATTADSESIETGRLFVESRAFRRAALEDAVVDPQNGYSASRLASYAVDGGWDDLPEWQPFDDWSLEWTHDELMRAGARAFSEFPMRVDQRLDPLRGAASAVAGIDPDTVVASGGGVAWTCATCHAAGGERGRPNADIDVAELYRVGDRTPGIVATWRAGTVDPSTDGANNPSVIGDLRAIRYQSHLHWTGTLRNSLAALAVRVDTLMIESMAEERRPPRELAFALAYYVWHLGGAPGEGRSDAFERSCGACHDASGHVGPPLPWVGEMHPGRGTGFHRVPSLYGVSDRGRLLHDGSVGSIEELLESGPSWHRYGAELDPPERIALAQWVREHFAAQSD